MLLQLTDLEKDKIHTLGKKMAMLCIPYHFGAEVVNLTVLPDKIKTIDCSELVEYIYYQLGYLVPDGSYNQHAASADVTSVEVGDMVFKHRENKINHVGLVVAVKPGIIVEADGWQKKVVLTPFEKFSHPNPKASQYAGCRRFLASKVKRV